MESITFYQIVRLLNLNPNRALWTSHDHENYEKALEQVVLELQEMIMEERASK